MSVIVLNTFNVYKWLNYMDKYNKRVFFLYNGRNKPYTVLTQNNLIINQYLRTEELGHINIAADTLDLFFKINKHLPLQDYQKSYINDLLEQVNFKRGK